MLQQAKVPRKINQSFIFETIPYNCNRSLRMGSIAFALTKGKASEAVQANNRNHHPGMKIHRYVAMMLQNLSAMPERMLVQFSIQEAGFQQ